MRRVNAAPDRSPRARTLTVAPDESGQRIDNFLVRVLKGVPRSHIYRVLRTGEVRVNGGRVKAHRRLEDGDEVRVPPLRLGEAQDPAIASDRQRAALVARVLHEDAHLLVLDKPSGLAVHGGSGVSLGVIETLRSRNPAAARWELVHRLDRETSGCLLVAKKRSALRELHAALREDRVGKRYLALLAGELGRDCTVAVPLRKNTLQGGERMVRVDADGQSARTDFKVRERLGGATLVEAILHTGRTHQIRVHAAHLGHPVGGDDKYGDAVSNRRLREAGLRRLFLHAWQVTFPHPADGRAVTVEAPLPDELQQFVEGLRR